jgi:hypothetical protein
MVKRVESNTLADTDYPQTTGVRFRGGLYLWPKLVPVLDEMTIARGGNVDKCSDSTSFGVQYYYVRIYILGSS